MSKISLENQPGSFSEQITENFRRSIKRSDIPTLTLLTKLAEILCSRFSETSEESELDEFIRAMLMVTETYEAKYNQNDTVVEVVKKLRSLAEKAAQIRECPDLSKVLSRTVLSTPFAAECLSDLKEAGAVGLQLPVLASKLSMEEDQLKTLLAFLGLHDLVEFRLSFIFLGLRGQLLLQRERGI